VNISLKHTLRNSIRTTAVWLAISSFADPAITGAALGAVETLHEFVQSTDGGAPVNSISLNGNSLFGSTWVGGQDGGGTLWSLDTNSHSFSKLYDFRSIDGTGPIGGVTFGESKLFGTTYLDGAYGGGTVWSFDLVNGSFSKLHDLNGDDGSFSNGDVAFDGDTLYGTTRTGGLHNRGTIWSFDLSGGVFTKLHDFTGSGINSGPVGGILVQGDKLLGTTYEGGTHGDGSIWSFDLENDSFTTLHNLWRGTDGEGASGDLTMDGTKIFGTAASGGANGSGTLWEFDTSAAAFSVLHHFSSSTDGRVPRIDDTLRNGALFGVSIQGGANNDGTLWSFDTINSTFTTLHDFDSSIDGYEPNGGIALGSSAIFGTTKWGVASGDGTIWKFAIPEPSAAVLSLGGFLWVSLLGRFREPTSVS
jgi:uncharacterized repeat protein (TIGR03803 family)